MESTALVSVRDVSLPAESPSPRLVRWERSAVSLVSTSTARIPALDGLRGIAILLVLLRHSVAGTPISSSFWSILLDPLRLSWSGVDLFFVLSGFLIGGILIETRQSPQYFKTFYIRRAFRILPVYFIFLVLYLARHLPIRLVPGALGAASPLPIPWFSFFTFTHNFWMVALGWFGPWAIAPTWSLAVEEQFYLTIPFLIRRIRTRGLYVTLTCVILGAPILRSILPHVLLHGDFANYVLMPCRADALCLGVLAALLYRSPQFLEWTRQRTWILHAAITATLAGVVFLTYTAWDQYTPPMATWGLSCLALFYACVLLSVVARVNLRLVRVLCFPPLMKLGTVAYCTYLIHAMLIQAVRTLLRAHTALSPSQVWATGGVLGVIVAVMIASLSWRFLEKPLLRCGHTYKYWAD